MIRRPQVTAEAVQALVEATKALVEKKMNEPEPAPAPILNRAEEQAEDLSFAAALSAHVDEKSDTPKSAPSSEGEAKPTEHAASAKTFREKLAEILDRVPDSEGGNR